MYITFLYILSREMTVKKCVIVVSVKMINEFSSYMNTFFSFFPNNVFQTHKCLFNRKSFIQSLIFMMQPYYKLQFMQNGFHCLAISMKAFFFFCIVVTPWSQTNIKGRILKLKLTRTCLNNLFIHLLSSL